MWPSAIAPGLPPHLSVSRVLKWLLSFHYLFVLLLVFWYVFSVFYSFSFMSQYTFNAIDLCRCSSVGPAPPWPVWMCVLICCFYKQPQGTFVFGTGLVLILCHCSVLIFLITFLLLFSFSFIHTANYSPPPLSHSLPPSLSLLHLPAPFPFVSLCSPSTEQCVRHTTSLTGVSCRKTPFAIIAWAIYRSAISPSAPTFPKAVAENAFIIACQAARRNGFE